MCSTKIQTRTACECPFSMPHLRGGIRFSVLPGALTLLCRYTPDDPCGWTYWHLARILAPPHPESDPQPLPSPPREKGSSRGSLSSEWSDTVIDGRGMLRHLQGSEIEIGGSVMYAVWLVYRLQQQFSHFFDLFYLFHKKMHVDMNL